MNFKIIRQITVLTLILAFTQESFAGQRRDRHDRRQGAQRARIAEGVKSGDLTKPEARRLRAQQRRIKRTEKRAEADGVVSKQEKQKLENMQDRANKNIYNQKHDDQQKTDTPAAN
jgi:hypothetical protein